MFSFKELKRFRKTLGSWLMATPQRPKSRPTFKPRLESLEPRWCPAGGGPDTDTMIWEPKNGSDDGGLNTNWFDQKTGMTATHAPTSTNPVIFDGNWNSPINCNPLAAASITLRNGYNALMTNSGGMLDYGSFSEGDTDTLNVYFNDAKTFQIAGGGSITNMTLSGIPTGALDLTGGTMYIAEGSYNETTGVGIYIEQDATLNHEGWTSLKFSNSNIGIAVYGTMNVFFGTGSGSTLIDRNGFSADVINVNGGTLTYLGSGGVTDTFDMNVRVQGSGDFIVTSAGNGLYAATLIVKGDPAYQSVYLTGATIAPSTIQLNKSATLQCNYGYLQDGGNLETMDSTTCTLRVGGDGKGTANITGGSILIDQPNVGYGTLKIDANLSFAGQLQVRIQGNSQGAGSCDLLNVTGTMTLNNGSSLYVYVNGNLVGGNSWVIIYANGGPLNQDFSFTNNNQTGLHSTLNYPQSGNYLLSF